MSNEKIERAPRITAHLSWVVLASLLGACDHNHLIGAYDGGAPSSGSAGAMGGAAGTTGGAAGTAGGAAGTAGGAAGTTGGAAGTAGGAAGTTGSVATGAAGTSVPVGPLGPPQSWTGYMENHQFPSGSDAMKLTFATDAAGNVVGTMIFGQGTPPPPATDPNLGYPAGEFFGIGFVRAYVAEGFSYAVTGTLVGNRLRLRVPLDGLWKDWCELQTSYSPPGSCLPATGGEMSGPPTSICQYNDLQTGAKTPVDCGKYSLCVLNRVCACNAAGCRIDPEQTGWVSFDVFLAGSTASGSTGLAGMRNVHFTKDP
jgi:hypothetical protein